LRGKQKAPRCASRGPSTNTAVTTKQSKLLPAPVPPNKTFHSPAEARPAPPDNVGESDEVFFIRRPSARQRLRLPFPSELPVEVWQPAAAAGLAAFVIVEMKRDVPGAPWIRSRQFVFAVGGTA
jgi:hypothetical protein